VLYQCSTIGKCVIYISLVLSVNVLYFLSTMGKCVIYISVVQKNKNRPKKFSTGPPTFTSTKRPACDAEQFRLVPNSRIRKHFPPRPMYTMLRLLGTETTCNRSSSVTGFLCKSNEGCNFVSAMYGINFSGLP